MNRIRIAIGAGALAVILSAVSLAASAASGSGTPTTAQPALAATVNSICKSYAPRFEAVTAPSFDPSAATAAQLPQAAKYLDEIVPLEQSEQQAVDGAGRPDTDTALYASVLSALSAKVSDETAARQAADARDLAKFHSAYTRDEADSTLLSGAAQQFGLGNCA